MGHHVGDMQTRFAVLSAASLSAIFVAACYVQGATVDTVDAGGPPPSSGDPTGVPCDVQTMLAHQCGSCHGAPPTSGAPNSLVSYADLTAMSKADPARTEAQLALARMQDGTMPPGGGATATDVATLQAWVDANTPQGTSCADPSADPLNADPVCTSGKKYTGGTGSSMRPGDACNRCHRFAIGGTVYPTGHEPLFCNGVSGSTEGVSVVVTDKNGVQATLAVNSVGNFYRSFGLTPPYKVKVTSPKGERVMSGAAPDGDCNKCHTASGAQGAPGRITVPF